MDRHQGKRITAEEKLKDAARRREANYDYELTEIDGRLYHVETTDLSKND